MLAAFDMPTGRNKSKCNFFFVVTVVVDWMETTLVSSMVDLREMIFNQLIVLFIGKYVQMFLLIGYRSLSLTPRIGSIYLHSSEFFFHCYRLTVKSECCFFLILFLELKPIKKPTKCRNRIRKMATKAIVMKWHGHGNKCSRKLLICFVGWWIPFRVRISVDLRRREAKEEKKAQVSRIKQTEIVHLDVFGRRDLHIEC